MNLPFHRAALATSLLVGVLAGCSLVTDYGGYRSANDGMDGGRDGGRDGGGDGGDTDGGRDAGTDGGPAVCDPACGTSGECVDGVCRCGGGDPCNAATACCEGACVAVGSDVDHCTGCGVACPSGARSERTCTDGTCGFACELGFADCDSAVAGCETDLTTPAACGRCGNACDVGELCTLIAGTYQCVDRCASGQTECGGACVDTSSSVSHCGGCGNACPSLANAMTTCMGGTCRYTCVGAFEDCDGDLATPASSNGCEVVPPLRFPDADGDGYGVMAGAVRRCGASPPPGFAAMSGDCNDSLAAVNPGATELCNGRDDNCNTMTDEGFDTGASCTCVAGAAAGMRTCSADGLSTRCTYPSEACNGLDDDCNGAADNGFACVRGAVSSCTITVGTCMATGSRTCSSTCTLGTCTPPAETCNGADDDCDGFADEDLQALAAETVGTYATGGGSAVPLEPSVVWAPGRSMGAAAWGSQRSGTSWDLKFARFDASGRVLTPEVTVFSGMFALPTSIRIGWDGSAWAIFYSEGSGMRVVRVADDGTTVSGSTPSASGQATFIMVAQGVDEMAIAWDRGSSELNANIYRNGSTMSGNLRLQNTTAPAVVRRPAMVHVGAGRYVAFLQNGTQVTVQPFRPAMMETSGSILVDVAIEVPVGATYDFTNRRIGFVYQSGSAQLLHIDPETMTMTTTPRALGSSAAPAVAFGNDGSFLATVNAASVTPTRVRVTDGTVYPGSVPTLVGAPVDVTGLAPSTNRYLVLVPMGGNLMTQVLTCR